MHRIIRIIPPLILLVLLWSCKRELPPSLEAWHIRYDIDYLEEMAGDIPTKILPKTMDAYYTDGFVYTRIDGFFNQFSLVQIADLRKRRVSTLMSFFGSKVFYTGKPGETPAGVYIPENMELSVTEDTLRIGGLLSERMDVVMDGVEFPIFYTRDLDVRRPNFSTPYRQVDHLLTDFRVQLSMLKMRARCASVKREVIDTELFLVPENFEEVNRESMEQLINSLFTKE